VLLAAAYLAVAAATWVLAPRPFRPLFDGFAPPQAYRWVNPPPELARDNQQPDMAQREVRLTEEGSEVSNTTTLDGQAIAGLELGSVPPNPPDVAVLLRLTPVDATTLAPLPDGLRAYSNAYRVELSYQPSGTGVTTLAIPGTIALTAVTDGQALLHSPDGQAWERKAARPFGATHGLFSALEAAGYYVVAGSGPLPTIPGGGGGSGTVPIVIGLALVPLVAAFFLMRGRGARPGPAAAS
jgi:hypothetical protein